ncbi:hypothetical protein ACTXT7_001736 [Hymenolepis weldensis]
MSCCDIHNTLTQHSDNVKSEEVNRLEDTDQQFVLASFALTQILPVKSYDTAIVGFMAQTFNSQAVPRSPHYSSLSPFARLSPSTFIAFAQFNLVRSQLLAL